MQFLSRLLLTSAVAVSLASCAAARPIVFSMPAPESDPQYLTADGAATRPLPGATSTLDAGLPTRSFPYAGVKEQAPCQRPANRYTDRQRVRTT